MHPSGVDCRDRTAEFFSTIQQIQKTQLALQPNGLQDATGHRPLPSRTNGAYNEYEDRPDEAMQLIKQQQPPKQQSQFTQAAQHIGRSIHMVTEKLEKLGKRKSRGHHPRPACDCSQLAPVELESDTSLCMVVAVLFFSVAPVAKQRSLFNDPATEINELTYVIKTDLSTLHNELEVLHKWVISHRDGASDASGSGGPPSKHEARNSTAIVDNLKQQLMTTTKSFQEVLQVRTTNLKEQNQRRKQFEAGAGGATGSSSSSSLSATGNAAVRKRGGNPFDALMNQAASHKATMVSGDNEATTEDALVGPDLLQSQSLLVAAPLEQDDYLTSRAQAVENIESTIVELGEMYKRLVHIVGMQEEITLRIDANMDDALEHMDKGHHQLLTYYESISGNRWLILKVFAVLLAFLVFFMIFVA